MESKNIFFIKTRLGTRNIPRLERALVVLIEGTHYTYEVLRSMVRTGTITQLF